MRIASLHRYPVKSLAGETLAAAALAPGRGILNDRRYAFVPAAPGAPPPAPGWRPKRQCVALVRYVSPARLAARYDDAGGVLTLGAGGREIAQGVPEQDAARARLEAAAADALSAEVGGVIALVAAGAGRDGTSAALTDIDAPLVSLVNLASVAALGAAMGARLDPLRFRANLYFADAPAWAERAWVGRTVALGDARLEVIEVTERCAAIDVDPGTATRDLRLLNGLAEGFGHVEMGIYARVVAGGTVVPGTALALA